MRVWPSIVAGLVLSCRPAAPVEPGPDEPATAVEPAPPAVEAKPEPEPVAEEPVPPAWVFMEEGWVRDPLDPGAPLLRLTRLRPSGDDEAPVQALLGALEPIMRCYEAELEQDPELRAELFIARREPSPEEPDGLDLRVQAPHETALLPCARPIVHERLPPQADDPHGRYAVGLYPHRDRAPRLRRPAVGDEVREAAGGSCWTLETYPCAPHKNCMAPSWERSLCRHPADDPGVALRWAFAEPDDTRWPIAGLELVGPEGTVVWHAALEPADAAAMGALHEDDARRHLASFREREGPGVWWRSVEPKRVLQADRAGVRAYDRRTGQVRFRYVSKRDARPQLFFDDGHFVATKQGAPRCKGDAGHGSFAAVCGQTLLYFDGHALAVIEVGQAVYQRAATELRESDLKGRASQPSAVIRAGGWRVKIDGLLFLE